VQEQFNRTCNLVIFNYVLARGEVPLALPKGDQVDPTCIIAITQVRAYLLLSHQPEIIRIFSVNTKSPAIPNAPKQHKSDYSQLLLILPEFNCE
jgi:hypothetical protein